MLFGPSAETMASTITMENTNYIIIMCLFFFRALHVKQEETAQQSMMYIMSQREYLPENRHSLHSTTACIVLRPVDCASTRSLNIWSYISNTSRDGEVQYPMTRTWSTYRNKLQKFQAKEKNMMQTMHQVSPIKRQRQGTRHNPQSSLLLRSAAASARHERVGVGERG